MHHAVLRVAFVEGVTPAKWARVWELRHPELPLELVPTDASGQIALLRERRVRMSFARLPVDDSGLHVIPLYAERPVVVVAKDHVLAAASEVTLAEIDELAGGRVHPFDDHVADTVALVAAGVGVVVVPHSIARLHARRDVVAREITDGRPTRIGLAWLADDGAGAAQEAADDGLDPEQAAAAIEDFVGVVRGRTVNSTRGRTNAAAPESSGPHARSGARPPVGAGGTRRRPPRRHPRKRRP